jgi:RNA polymerase sigma factor (sigma-70 family)
MDPRPDEYLPTRASLLSRLKDWSDDESWREFYSLYKCLICATALKAGLTEAEAEDVVQETMLSVAKTIKEFKYDRTRCTFKSWLRHLAQKRIADRFRKRSREPQVSRGETSTGDTRTVERVPDPESLDLEGIWDKEWQEKLLEAALARVRSQASPEQYQIFDFSVLRKMPVKEVATTLEVSVAQVYLARHRIAKLIKKETRDLEQKMERNEE